MKKIFAFFMIVAIGLSFLGCESIERENHLKVSGEYSNKKMIMINKTGEELFECEYQYTLGYNEDLAAVMKNNEWGYIDKTGVEIIPCKYDIARNFYNGIACVGYNGKWGAIDKEGNEVIKFQYEYMRELNPEIDNLFLIWGNGKYGIIDKNGNELIKCKYDSIFYDQEIDAFIVNKNGKWGTIDKEGKEIIKCGKYTSEEFIKVVKWGEENSGEKEKFSKFLFERYKIDTLREFSEDFALIKKNDKWGYVNNNGEKVIDFTYEDACDFKEGLATVKLDGKWGYINKEGEVIIELKYKDVESFCDGIAIVSKEDEFYNDDIAYGGFIPMMPMLI